jgi:cholesterol transport system auxiliary component
MTRYLARIVVAATALGLCGCVSLLPKSKPAHLYRFGQPAAAEAVTAPAGDVGVFKTIGGFQREAAGDRILTIDGGKAAYVADTRWVAPAAVLWEEAVTAAFDADPGPTRLVPRGEPASAEYVLRLDVRHFEARYENGPKAAPTVLVRVRGVMIRGKDAASASERIFENRVRADDNRVSAIVPAFDQAVAEVLAEVVAWTNALAKAS